MENIPAGAVILTGGGAVRLGGADKASVELAGRTLLEHALDALVDVDEVVVVGPTVPTNRPVTFVREDPVGGGPAAGLLAGLAGFPRLPEWVLVLAVDMPLVTRATVRRLSVAVQDDGAALVDDEGRVQFLCAVYSTAALTRERPPYGDEHGLSMRALVSSLQLAQVPALGTEAQDVDTWEDVRRLREQLEG